jgi:hypothetical protein
MLRSARSFGAPIGAILLLLVVLPGTASADLGEVDCDPQDPFCDILAEDDDEDVDGASDGNGGSENDGSTPGGGEGEEVDCTTQPGQPLPEECMADPQMTPIADLAEQARGRLNLPQPEMASSPADRQLVHLPTWLAVSESSWDSVSASVTAGAVTVTATAVPSRVEWDLGDGTVVICEGPGTIWRPGMDPEAESPDCGHTYTRSASGVEVMATVYWTVTWTSTAGAGGSFADLATASQAVWEVAEARSVIVR